MQVAFVECDDAICGDVSHVSETLSVGYDQLWFSMCPVETLDEVIPKLEQTLQQVVDKGVDMELMGTEIKRFRRNYKVAMENAPADQLYFAIIKHFLYAERDPSDPSVEHNSMKVMADQLKLLQQLEETFTTSKQWCDLLQADFIDAPKVYVKVSERRSARVVVVLVIRLFLPFFSFHIDVQMACFGPTLNNTLAQKDAPGRTSRRV